MENKWLILRYNRYGSIDEGELFNGTLEEAIKAAKDEYDNYGHNKALVVKYDPYFLIEKGDIETSFK